MRLLKGWLGVLIITLLVAVVLAGGAVWCLLCPRRLGWFLMRNDGILQHVRVNDQALGIAVRGPGNEHTESFRRVLPAGGARALTLANVAGRVTVESRPSGEVEITAVKRTWGTAARAREVLELMQVQVEARPDTVVVTTEPTDRWPPYSSVDFRVRVPHGFAITVQAITSQVEVNGVFDSVAINVVTGLVDLDAQEPVQELTIEMVTGAATASFTPVPGGRYQLAVTTGLVMAEIPATSGIEVRLTVVAGYINPGPGPWEIRAADGRRFEGTAAGGGARLTMTAVTGTITLTRH